jgi:hypothetical protein
MVKDARRGPEAARACRVDAGYAAVGCAGEPDLKLPNLG